MLKGERGPERLYVDIDPMDGGDGRQPASQRFSADIVKKHQFSGTEAGPLVEVAKLWVDEPARFVVPPSPIARAFRPVVSGQSLGCPGCVSLGA